MAEARPRRLMLEGMLAIGAAGLSGLAAATLSDSFAPLAVGVCVCLGLFAAVAPPAQAITVVLASTVPGILGRVQLFSVGIKAVPLRPEEAAVLGLWVGHGMRLLPKWRTSPPILRAWIVFTGLAWISLFASLRLWTPGQIAAGSLYSVRWALFGIVLWAAIDEARKGPEARQRLVTAVIGSGVALSALGFLQFLFLPNMRDLKAAIPQVAEVLTDPHEERLVSTVLDPNLLGALLAPAISLSFAALLRAPAGKRAVPLAMFTTLLAAVLLTVSRGTLLASALGCAVVAVLTAPRLLWSLVLLVPVTALAAPRLFQRYQDALWSRDGVPLQILGFSFQPEPSAYARIRSWAAAFGVIREHPLLGVGYNNYGLSLLERQDRDAVLYGTDSTLLLVLATCGLVGFAAFTWMLARLGRDAWAGVLSADVPARAMGAGILGALASVLLASVFTNALIYPPVLIYLWVMAGTAASFSASPGQARVPARATESAKASAQASAIEASAPPMAARP